MPIAGLWNPEVFCPGKYIINFKKIGRKESGISCPGCHWKLGGMVSIKSFPKHVCVLKGNITVNLNRFEIKGGIINKRLPNAARFSPADHCCSIFWWWTYIFLFYKIFVCYKTSAPSITAISLHPKPIYEKPSGKRYVWVCGIMFLMTLQMNELWQGKINPFQFSKITPARANCTSSMSAHCLRALASSKMAGKAHPAKSNGSSKATMITLVARHRAVFCRAFNRGYANRSAISAIFSGGMKGLSCLFYFRFWKSVCSPKLHILQNTLSWFLRDLQFLRLKNVQWLIVIKNGTGINPHPIQKNESMRFSCSRALQF